MRVYLQKGKDKPIRMGHPWVFSGAIVRVDGDADAITGELCEVVSAGGELLGTGYYNAHSTIRVRMLTTGAEKFSIDVLVARIADAAMQRRPILSGATDSCRLVNSEGDRLPGLIVDKFGTGLCIQILTAGMERFRPQILDCLLKHFSPEFLFERSDSEVRSREGLGEQEGLLYGTVPENHRILENGHHFLTDLAKGQKTGFFLDQRENRRLFSSYASGRTIADCFSYTAGFSVYGLLSGARFAAAIDISENALAGARKNFNANSISKDRYECVCTNVFEYFRRPTGDRRYDCIVLDPPKFAKHKGEVDRAARGYKDINLSAFKNIDSGGIVFTFSCSNAIDPYLFRQIVFAAAADSRRNVQVLHVLGAGPDHPFSIAHREGEYLKGLVLRVS